MISDEGAPILMDFGSCVKARMKIDNRQQALIQQVLTAGTTSAFVYFVSHVLMHGFLGHCR